MLSTIELLTAACAMLDKKGIAVQADRCLHRRHIHSSCRRCAAVCPNAAISCQEGLVLQAEQCTGCGACVSVCPGGVFAAKQPSTKALRSLVACHVKQSGAVAFACDTYLKAHPQERNQAISVPCTARCDEALLVETIFQGAAKVFLINSACTDCRQNQVCGLVATMVDTVNRLLGCWHNPRRIAFASKIPEIIKPLPVTEEQATGMTRRDFLSAFRSKGTALFTQVIPAAVFGTADSQPEPASETNRLAESKELPEKWSSLANCLEKAPQLPAVPGFQSNLWGKVAIADSCSGCGACAAACPTAALLISRQDGNWRLSFQAAYCTQCGLCKDVCCTNSVAIADKVDLNELAARRQLQQLLVKSQQDVEILLEPLEQRMARLLGCVIKN